MIAAAVHIMLDIETLGTRPGSMLSAIGACTLGVAPAMRRTFYVRTELEGQDRLGLHADPATLRWWLRQDAAARREITETPTATLTEGLLALSSFLVEARYDFSQDAEKRPLCIWSYGPSFDAPLVEAAWRAAGAKLAAERIGALFDAATKATETTPTRRGLRALLSRLTGHA